MKKNKLKILISALLLSAVCLTACSKTPNTVPSTTAPYTVPTTSVPFTVPADTVTTAAETTSGTAEEPEKDDFEFEEKEAQKLGKMQSDIYGELEVYYQDAHIALVDSYDTLLFSFPAQGFAPPGKTGNKEENNKEKTVESDDMNFDGYADLRLLYRSTSLNTYYLCWMWDMATKSFVYYEPLTSIPTPSFEKNAHTVVSINKSSKLSATLTTYKWQDGELAPIEHRMVSVEEETAHGSDDIDSALSITDGMQISFVMLNTGENSNSRWLCKIENEKIVQLLTETYNESQLIQKFAFVGSEKGTTTVVFRYAIDWNSDYIAEKAVNITVNDDKSLTILEIK